MFAHQNQKGKESNLNDTKSNDSRLYSWFNRYDHKKHMDNLLTFLFMLFKKGGIVITDVTGAPHGMRS